jgi:hypothetical protein
MGETTLPAKLGGDDKNCGWIYRIRANPGMPQGGVLPPKPVLAPRSALATRPRVDLRSDPPAKSPECTSGQRRTANHFSSD